MAHRFASVHVTLSWLFAFAAVALLTPLTALADELVRIRLQATDVAGNPITFTTIDSDFQIRGYVQDLRAGGWGVLSAYSDIIYNSTVASAAGPIMFDPFYDAFRNGSTVFPGIVDELGATGNFFSPPGPSEKLQFIIPFRANAAGVATFTLDPADAPGHDVLLYGLDPPVPLEEIDFTNDLVLIFDDVVPGDTAPFDGVVDLTDLNNVRNHFGETGVPLPGMVQGDVFPFDGDVNEDDLNAVRNNFGAGNPVPEPPSLVLLAAGAAGLAALRRRRAKHEHDDVAAGG